LPRDVVLSGANNVHTFFLKGATAPLKFGIAKNVQNSSRFRTTFNFEREYLWNGQISTSVEQKKFGELWSTNDNG